MAWYNSSWSYRTKVTVLATKVDADLTDFPVYVDLSDLPAEFHSHCNQTDARDIRVTTSGGSTEVPREVVFYNSATDTGELHFKGNIDGDTDTDFYIYYGNASVSDYAVDATYGRNNVWTNYAVVLHLDESGDGALDEYSDSTGNGNDGRGGNGTGSKVPTKITNGKIGTAQSFDGSDDFIILANDATLNTDYMSWSVWVYWDSSLTYKFIIDHGYTGHFLIYTSGSAGRIQAYVTTSSGQPHPQIVDAMSTGAWHFIVVTYDGSNATIYIDNASPVSVASTGTMTDEASDAFFIGQYQAEGAQFAWNGDIDEVKVSNIARSATWVSTEYNNQSDPDTFFTVGSEETESGVVGTTGPFPVFFRS